MEETTNEIVDIETPEVETSNNEEVEIDTENETSDETNEQTTEDNDNLDDMFDDDTDVYTVAGYNLSKYKDILDFENEEVMTEFNSYAEKFANKGFTQEQIEFILDDKLEDLKDDNKPKKPTKEEIKNKLTNSLSREEKRNYKAINSFIAGALNGTELQGKEKEIMSNPALVKLCNIIYKQSLSKTTNLKSTQKPNEKNIRTTTLDEAYDRLLESTKDTSINKEELIKELRSTVADRQGLEELLSIIN